MVTDSYVRQDLETYHSIVPIFIGEATQLTPRFPGEILFQFKKGDKDKIVRFDWVSSVMYCDELLWTRDNYPYVFALKGEPGLYEIKGSSYLLRVQGLGQNEPMFYEDHRHYIYLDPEFNWHITACGLEISDA
jgi:hypothetical protein